MSVERTVAARAARSSISVEHLLSPASAHSPGSEESPPIKRRKYSNSPNVEKASTTTPRNAPEPITFSLDADPFQIDPKLTQIYLENFLEHLNEQLYTILPRRRFLHWASSRKPKSSNDRLLLYSMMAFGTIFSSTDDQVRHGNDFVAMTEAGLARAVSMPALQVVQVLMVMTMTRFSRGRTQEARESCGLMMRMAIDLDLNREPASVTELCFGLDENTFLECRRRTFWAAYMADSTLRHCIAPSDRVPAVDCALRMPCDNVQFESGTVPEIPMAVFKGSHPHDVPLSDSNSMMAKLLGGTAILRDTVSFIQCLKGIYPEQVQASQTNFQDTMTRRLEQWRKKVSPPLGKKQGEAGQEPCAMLLLYHFAKMLLHRHIRHEYMPKQQIEANCREARDHAYEFLGLQHRLGENSTHEAGALIIACPIMGFATFIAVDIITAAGSMSSVMENTTDDHNLSQHTERMDTGSNESFIELMTVGMETLINLGHYWESARQQGELTKARFHAIMAARGSLSHKAAYFVRQPLYSPFGEEQDVIYGLEKATLFNALGMGDLVASEADLCEV